MTLNEIRIANNLTQFQVAEKLKVTQPEISNYENGTDLPTLENSALLEKLFSVNIHWNEDYTPKRKDDIIQATIELCQKYPLSMVFEFLSRAYRREKNPDDLIIHYGNIASEGNEPPLLNNDFKSDN